MSASSKGDEHPWMLNTHARQRAAGRGLDERDVLAVCSAPELVRPDMKGDPDVRMLVGRGIVVIANVVERVVITCGPSGGDDADWHVDAARVAALDADDSALPSKRTSVPSSRRTARASAAPSSRRRASAVQTRHVLGDDVHPGIRESVAQLVDGDWSRVRVLSPTRVEIDPPRGER